MIDFAATDYGQEEIDAVARVLKSDWLASGEENIQFEKEFATYVGAKYAVVCNSGSSANLLALACLGIRPGGAVVTSACGFPATLSPILHLGLRPVLVDYALDTFNADVEQIRKVAPGCQAIILAHTLGNPVDITPILDLGIPIIEDCCEAIGGAMNGRKLGTVGTLGTYSFYPAHQITALGGGGMVVTNDEAMYQRMKSLRDWGKQYTWDSSLGGNETDYSSPIGYHRGYTYDTIGWNFKLPEANCAFGREQLKRLDLFSSKRWKNWAYLRAGLQDVVKIAPMGVMSSPFGFCMLVEGRNKFSEYLTSKGIKNRPFFAGNILRQPAFKGLSEYAGNFPVADRLMRDALFIGCHTKLTQANLDYMVEVIRDYSRHTEL